MFARIYPVLRLPRRFGVFDYRIPDGVTVEVGDLVHVPFHGRTATGVVAHISETTTVMSNISDVTDVAWHAALSFADVARLTALAASIAQSPSTLLYHLFGSFGNDASTPAFVNPPSSPLALSRTVAETLSLAIEQAKPGAPLMFHTSPEGGLAMAQLLRKKHTNQVLVLVPRERDADLTARLVTLGSRTAVLHGTTKPRQRERIIRAWRAGAIDTLIGTRQAALLPAKKISAVLVLTSGTEDHFNDRKNPRLDTRNLGYLQATQHEAIFATTDVLPRPEEFAAFPNQVWTDLPQPVEAIDLRSPLHRSDYAMLTMPLLEGIKTALQSQKKVILFYNRKGIAKRAQCRKCSTVLVCDCGLPYGINDEGLYCGRCGTKRPVPDACPSCNDGVVGLRGIGNVHIEKSLQELFPHATVGRVEKGHARDDAQILLVTEYFFSSVSTPFARKEFGLVADLAADLSLHPDDFRSGEATARKLQRLRWFAHQQGAVCMAQSWLPDETRALVNAKTFLTEETAIRNKYGLPPKRAVITVRHADAEALTSLTGHFFAPVTDDTVTTRVPYSALDTLLRTLASLPDTAVVSVDSYAPYYEAPECPPRTES